MQENFVEMMRQEKGIPGTVEQEKGPKITTWQGDNKSPVSKEREGGKGAFHAGFLFTVRRSAESEGERVRETLRPL